MFNSKYSRYTDEIIKNMKVSELKYNIARQELYLNFLIELGMLYDNKICYTKITKNYWSFIEEAGIPALSICRLIKERESDGVHSFLVSRNYDYSNPFRITGFNGNLLVYNHKTVIIGDGQELNCNFKYNSDETNHTTNFRHIFYNLPFDKEKTLIFVQGQPERAFSLVGSEYDTAFGDIFDPDDVETDCFYNGLLSYMDDYYSNSNIDVYNYSKKEDGKVYRLIYCPKR